MNYLKNPYDFSWMLNGKHLGIPTLTEAQLVQPVEINLNTKNSSALLLLHGFSSSPAVFRYFYPELRGYDFVHAPILKGHGDTLDAFSLVKASEWVAEVEVLLAALCKNYKSVDVLGLSLGGLLSSYVAPHFPIRQLFLLAPALCLQQPIHYLKRVANLSRLLGFYSIRNRGGNLCSQENAELTYRQLPITTILEILNLIENYQHKNWSVPTTLFLGQHDAVVHSMKVAEALRGLPRLKTFFLEHSAHVLPIDNDYQFIIDTINHSHPQT